MKALLNGIRELILSTRTAVVHSVETIQVYTNFEIGHRIVEHEQGGEERARYGEALLKEMAASLTVEFGKGFSLTNLKLMRQFYLTYRQQIGQTASNVLPLLQKGQTPSDQSAKTQTASGKFVLSSKRQTLSTQFTLSWSHYGFLMGINDGGERSFYEIEETSQNGSLRELKRQFNSGLYERLALSRDKDDIHPGCAGAETSLNERQGKALGYLLQHDKLTIQETSRGFAPKSIAAAFSAT